MFRAERRMMAELAATLAALHELNRWVEEQLFLAREASGLELAGGQGPDVPPRAA